MGVNLGAEGGASSTPKLTYPRHGKAWPCHPRVRMGKAELSQANSWMPVPSTGMTKDLCAWRLALADTAVIGPAPAGIEAAVYLEELAHPKACSDKGQNDRCPDNPFPH